MSRVMGLASQSERKPMQQSGSYQAVCILHEFDLGTHTLFLLSDGSMNLFANDEETVYLADNGLHLDCDETYRLFISLREQFLQKVGNERS